MLKQLEFYKILEKKKISLHHTFEKQGIEWVWLRNYTLKPLLRNETIKKRLKFLPLSSDKLLKGWASVLSRRYERMKSHFTFGEGVELWDSERDMCHF